METPAQKKQYAFLERMVQAEIRAGLNPVNTYICDCRSCRDHKEYHTPEMAIRFVGEHEGHNTFISTSGFKRV